MKATIRWFDENHNEHVVEANVSDECPSVDVVISETESMPTIIVMVTHSAVMVNGVVNEENRLLLIEDYIDMLCELDNYDDEEDEEDEDDSDESKGET